MVVFFAGIHSPPFNSRRGSTRPSSRQPDMERTARAHRALHPDHSAMQLDDALADGQAYPKAVHLTREPRVDAVKRVFDPSDVLGGNPNALVADADLDPLPLPRQFRLVGGCHLAPGPIATLWWQT